MGTRFKEEIDVLKYKSSSVLNNRSEIAFTFAPCKHSFEYLYIALNCWENKTFIGTVNLTEVNLKHKKNCKKKLCTVLSPARFICVRECLCTSAFALTRNVVCMCIYVCPVLISIVIL